MPRRVCPVTGVVFAHSYGQRVPGLGRMFSNRHGFPRRHPCLGRWRLWLADKHLPAERNSTLGNIMVPNEQKRIPLCGEPFRSHPHPATFQEAGAAGLGRRHTRNRCLKNPNSSSSVLGPRSSLPAPRQAFCLSFPNLWELCLWGQGPSLLLGKRKTTL